MRKIHQKVINAIANKTYFRNGNVEVVPSYSYGQWSTNLYYRGNLIGGVKDSGEKWLHHSTILKYPTMTTCNYIHNCLGIRCNLHKGKIIINKE